MEYAIGINGIRDFVTEMVGLCVPVCAKLDKYFPQIMVESLEFEDYIKFP